MVYVPIHHKRCGENLQYASGCISLYDNLLVADVVSGGFIVLGPQSQMHVGAIGGQVNPKPSPQRVSRLKKNDGRAEAFLLSGQLRMGCRATRGRKKRKLRQGGAHI